MSNEVSRCRSIEVYTPPLMACTEPVEVEGKGEGGSISLSFRGMPQIAR